MATQSGLQASYGGYSLHPVLERIETVAKARLSWRLAGHEPVPAIYGPSGDVKWDEKSEAVAPARRMSRGGTVAFLPSLDSARGLPEPKIALSFCRQTDR